MGTKHMCWMTEWITLLSCPDFFHCIRVMSHQILTSIRLPHSCILCFILILTHRPIFLLPGHPRSLIKSWHSLHHPDLSWADKWCHALDTDWAYDMSWPPAFFLLISHCPHGLMIPFQQWGSCVWCLEPEFYLPQPLSNSSGPPWISFVFTGNPE